MAPRENVSSVVCRMSAADSPPSARSVQVRLEIISASAGPRTVTRLTPKQLLSIPPNPLPAVL